MEGLDDTHDRRQDTADEEVKAIRCGWSLESLAGGDVVRDGVGKVSRDHQILEGFMSS